MKIEWAPSAAKHDIARADVLYAITTGSLAWLPEFEASRAPGGSRPHLFIGWDRAHGTVLEVLAEIDGDVLVIFHAMHARPKMVDLAKRRKK